MSGLLYSLPPVDDYTRPTFIPVPLTRVEIRARVVNFISEVEVIQEYQNKEKDPIEVIYFFPVEEEAAVTACCAELEGRTVEAKIQEKEKAQKLYDEAIKERKTAFLLEETKADIFQLKIGNLSPGSGCTVKITYLMELPVEDGKTRVTIPTTIAPRYVPAKDGSDVAKKIASIEYDFTSPAPLHLKMDIAMKTKIMSVTSPSHEIVNQMEDKDGSFAAVTKFDGTTTDMDRDIVVLIDSDEPHQPKVVVEKGDDGSVAALLSMVPKFELKKQPSEIIFLIDCSGSMGGQSMKLAKQALQLFVHSLPVDSYFNIFCFGSRFTQLFPQSQPFTDETLDSAKKLLAGIDANLGGTEIYQPLKAIFTSKNLVGKPRQVFVITDGEVSNSEQCIHLVEEHNQHNRVFTLGIGASADRHLVKGMARVGRGLPIFTTYGENIAGKVMKLLKQSLQPCVHDVQIKWTSGEALDIESSQAPLQAPPVYDGSRMLIYKLWGTTGGVGEKVTITAKTPEGNLSLDVKIDKESFVEGEIVHKMFARKMIQELEENFEKKDPGEVKSIITELGLKYSLGTKHTAFIAVDDKTNEEGGIKTRQVRNQVPHGYGGIQMDIANRSKSLKTSRMMCAPGAAPPSSAPCAMSRSGPVMNSMNSATDFYSVMYCSGEEEACDMEFGLFDGGESEESDDMEDDSCLERCVLGATKAKKMSKSREGNTSSSNNLSRSRESVKKMPKTNMDKIVALTSLQTAAGYFKEDNIIKTIIGDKFAVFQEQCKGGNIESRVWITALIIAFIQKNFPDERDSWELIVEKAEDWLGNTDVIVSAAQCLAS